MGRAALYHLAHRGQRVLLERFSVPNELGSSQGVTRIIRLAYYEDPAYVPLLRRAYELWRELERLAGEQLLHITGSVDAGPEIFEGSLRSCLEHDLPHEVLTAQELGRRFPGYRLPEDTRVLFQPDGGFLLPERCIAAHAREAETLGAVVRTGERVLDSEPADDTVRVRSEHGLYEAERVVFCARRLVRAGRAVADRTRGGRAPGPCLEPLEPELFQPQRFPVFDLVEAERVVFCAGAWSEPVAQLPTGLPDRRPP